MTKWLYFLAVLAVLSCGGLALLFMLSSPFIPTPTPTPTPERPIIQVHSDGVYINPMAVQDDAAGVECYWYESGCFQCVPTKRTPTPQPQIIEGGKIIDQERGVVCWRDKADTCYSCLPMEGTINLPEVKR